MNNDRESPQKRYVYLHRLVEQGHADDAIWEELSHVCCRLGYVDEGIGCAESIGDQHARWRARQRLARVGVPVVTREAAPPESGTKPPREQVTSPGDELRGAFRYLELGTLPRTAVLASLAFPATCGIGVAVGERVGPTVLVLPILLLGVGALTRQVLLDARHGIDFPPGPGELDRPLRGGALFARDAVLVSALVLGPAFLVHWALGLLHSLLWLALASVAGGFALAVCQARGDLRGLSPSILHPAARTVGVRGLLLVGFAVLLFLPALVVFLCTAGRGMDMRVAVLGPLLVAPMILAARIVGRVLYVEREALHPVMDTPFSDGPRPERSDETVRVYAAQPNGNPAQPNGNPARAPQDRRQAAPVRRRSANRADVVGEVPIDPASLPGFRVVPIHERERVGAASKSRVMRRR